MAEPSDQPREPGTELVPRQGPVRAVEPDGGAELERPAVVSLVPAVAAATGGFLLGVAAFVFVRILRRPKPARLRLGRRGRKGDRLEVAGSRSFLVDVHLLDRR